ncbi:MAG: YopX family protein [Chitinophagaceae bacterium]
MREIKFRGWHTKKQKMFSAENMAIDQLTLLPTGEFINVSGMDTKLSHVFTKNEFVPLQYTGLKDKNGKEIYEGDIVKSIYNPRNEYYTKKENMMIVEYDICNPCFVLIDIKNKNIMEYDFVCCNMRSNEVIGNIYENPELINQDGAQDKGKLGSPVTSDNTPKG